MRTADTDAGDRTLVERVDPLIGTVLDQRFCIDFQLAAGGFGAIYRATDLRADAEVALKVLHPKLLGDPSVVERFRREGATLANLRDPHTITAYEIGEAADGTLYIVLELLHGESLYERFRASGPMPWRRVVHIARGVCSSLAEAHAAGIVHRDLKPANIHLETRGADHDFVKVLDFGIAKIIQGGGAERNDLTQAGQMIGTVDYMSPEQMVGGELTGRSDIYTLGVVIYEMISGRTPFADAQTATAILGALLTRTPDPLSRHASVPRLLDEVVARCIERDAVSRFGDISELADALAEVAAIGAARGAPVAAPPERPYLGVPTLRFEPSGLTAEATRVDVRRIDSTLPVLDARGPRVRPPDVLGTPEPRPAAAGPALATPHPSPAHARSSQLSLEAPSWRPDPMAEGSHHTIGDGGPRPVFDQRGSHPIFERGAWHDQRFVQGASPPRAPVQGYDMAAAATRDAMVRRIIWIVLLVVAIAAVVLATR